MPNENEVDTSSDESNNPEEQIEGATAAGEQEEPEQQATPKKEYITKHGDCKGFANESDNPRAPSANMMMRVTKAGLEAWLARLEAANVEEGDIEYVMFSKTGNRSDGKGEYCFMNLMESRPRDGQEQAPTI